MRKLGRERVGFYQVVFGRAEVASADFLLGLGVQMLGVVQLLALAGIGGTLAANMSDLERDLALEVGEIGGRLGSIGSGGCWRRASEDRD